VVRWVCSGKQRLESSKRTFGDNICLEEVVVNGDDGLFAGLIVVPLELETSGRNIVGDELNVQTEAVV